MCCFSQPTQVSGTRIFARQTRPGRQALVYQMAYDASVPTAMILPLPVALPASDGAVTWKDLKGYPNFFADLDQGFPTPQEPSSSPVPASAAAHVLGAPLAVVTVGDFEASFVPRAADFARLDPRFVIAESIWRQIPEYADYGFAVFQLKELAGVPHPIAFEFQSRLRGQLFFPTVHIHDGTVHPEDGFDHTLYLQSAAYDTPRPSYAGPHTPNARTGFVCSKGRLSSFASADRARGVLDPALLVHRGRLSGVLPNVDTFVNQDLSAAAPRATRPGVITGSLGGPTSLALAALGWTIGRRNARRGGSV